MDNICIEIDEAWVSKDLDNSTEDQNSFSFTVIGSSYQKALVLDIIRVNNL